MTITINNPGRSAARNRKNGDPFAAVRWGIANGASTRTRETACQTPETAYRYAVEVDRGSHDVTRAGACKSLQWGMKYAYNVDKGPHPRTRELACRDADTAYDYALKLDKGPHDFTRIAACRNITTAWLYAADIDRGPHRLTREFLCAQRNPQMALSYAVAVERAAHALTREIASLDTACAYIYARDIDGPHWMTREATWTDAGKLVDYAVDVDRGSRDDTRIAACLLSSWCALQYARYVDTVPHRDTRESVCANPDYALQYAIEIDKAFHPDTYAAVQVDSALRWEYCNRFGSPLVTDIDYAGIVSRFITGINIEIGNAVQAQSANIMLTLADIGQNFTGSTKTEWDFAEIHVNLHDRRR